MRSASAPYRSAISSGSMPFPRDFAHLAALVVADESVDKDRVKGLFLHVPQPEKIIRATQKKMMRSRHKHVRDKSISGPPSPLASRAWKNGHSAEENHVSSTSPSRVMSLLRHFRTRSGPRARR